MGAEDADEEVFLAWEDADDEPVAFEVRRGDWLGDGVHHQLDVDDERAFLVLNDLFGVLG